MILLVSLLTRSNTILLLVDLDGSISLISARVKKIHEKTVLKDFYWMLFLEYCNNRLCFNFILDADGCDLSIYEPELLGSCLKKFFRELPDPLIPCQWYDSFIEASRKFHFHNYTSCISQFKSLIKTRQRASKRT